MIATNTGVPFQYNGKNLHDAHFYLHIKLEQFDAATQELANALDYYKIPEKECNEVLTALITQKPDVTTGARAGVRESISMLRYPMSLKYHYNGILDFAYCILRE